LCFAINSYKSSYRNFREYTARLYHRQKDPPEEEEEEEALRGYNTTHNLGHLEHSSFLLSLSHCGSIVSEDLWSSQNLGIQASANQAFCIC
jgi:hypothetical protein